MQNAWIRISFAAVDLFLVPAPLFVFWHSTYRPNSQASMAKWINLKRVIIIMIRQGSSVLENLVHYHYICHVYLHSVRLPFSLLTNDIPFNVDDVLKYGKTQAIVSTHMNSIVHSTNWQLWYIIILNWNLSITIETLSLLLHFEPKNYTKINEMNMKKKKRRNFKENPFDPSWHTWHTVIFIRGRTRERAKEWQRALF